MPISNGVCQYVLGPPATLRSGFFLAKRARWRSRVLDFFPQDSRIRVEWVNSNDRFSMKISDLFLSLEQKCPKNILVHFVPFSMIESEFNSTLTHSTILSRQDHWLYLPRAGQWKWNIFSLRTFNNHTVWMLVIVLYLASIFTIVHVLSLIQI